MRDTVYEELYGVGLLDDLHNYFPELLYRPQNFSTVQDVLYYIQSQTQVRLNPFTRGLQQFNQQYPVVNTTVPLPRAGTTTPPPISTRSPMQRVEVYETMYNLSPLFSNISSQPPSILRNTRIPQNTLINEVLNLLSPGAASFMDPVIVRPTAAQIDAATELTMATGDESTGDNDTLCSICQDTYIDGQAIRTIRHCNHRFHKSCIDSWFDQNVHCPVCRFDIREDS
jgi:hypothetical protein